jgi:pyruvate, water dikinase
MRQLGTLFIVVTFFCHFEVNAQQFVTELENSEQFTKLASLPLNSNLGQVQSIKLVVDLKTEKIYFINSKLYQFHAHFCANVMHDDSSIDVFNRLNYGTSENRKYLLGNVNFNPVSQSYFIDLSVFDYMPADLLIQLFHTVNSHAFFKDNLALLLNTERLMGLGKELQKSIRVITPSELYKDQTYQLISPGTCVGRIRFEPNLDSLKAPLHPDDILITHGTPSYIPNVLAVITDEFQTPLSHLSILGKNRKIPIAVDKKLMQDTDFIKLEGKWVKLQLDELKLSYSPRSKEHVTIRSSGKEIHLKCDSLTQEIIRVNSLEKAGPNTIGNKAANFGFLNRIASVGSFKTPESAFAIPFYYYLKHVQTTNIQALLVQLKQSNSINEDSLKLLLKNLQTEIKQTRLDSTLIQKIYNQLKLSEYSTFRFRSSTNAEDFKGFSGAGLYESKTVDLSSESKTIEKAVLAVWASLWSFEAFQERRFFHLSDENLAMGILVHRSFPQEEANGVVITKNVYRSHYPGFSVNVQLGDVSVVEPPLGIICDQISVIYELTESGFNRTVEYISNSSLTNTQVLSPEELKKLEVAIETVKKAFWKERRSLRTLVYDDFGLDIEFKIQGEKRELYLKQVRYFNE